jgi:hypothetical protein
LSTNPAQISFTSCVALFGTPFGRPAGLPECPHWVADWPEMQDRMIDTLIRLETALRKPIQELNI